MTIGIGIIGLGFMGCTHLKAYQAAQAAGFDCRVRAVCDPSPHKRAGGGSAGGNIATGSGGDQVFDPREVSAYERPAHLLADSSVQLVSICTYTDSHVELALQALAAGKHVLVEKPISLRSAEVERLADAAAKSGLRCMPAMCMRFWPGWDWLAARVRDGSLGAVRSATFSRLGGGPAWAGDFYKDLARSGGALFDLHIHDTDFICSCFGVPDAVSSAGDLSHLTTQYTYSSGPGHITAEGAWDLAPSAGFRMRFLVNFERATAEFDISATPWLRLHMQDRSEDVVLSAGTGYDGQVRHLLEAIRRPELPLRATMDDARSVAVVLEAERASLDSRKPERIAHD